MIPISPSSPPAFHLCHTQQMQHSLKSRGSSRPIPPPVCLFPPLSITASLGGINLARTNCSLCLMVTGLIKHDWSTSFALVPPLLLCLSLSVAGRGVSCQMKRVLWSHVWAAYWARCHSEGVGQDSTQSIHSSIIQKRNENIQSSPEREDRVEYWLCMFMKKDVAL